jgi:hypothetical protein
MKILKAKTSHPKKKTFLISDLVFIKKDPLPALMNGEQMIDPIEIEQHQISPITRYGAGGVIYKEKKYSTYKGSQRINAAIQLGYDAIEGIIINEH